MCYYMFIFYIYNIYTIYNNIEGSADAHTHTYIYITFSNEYHFKFGQELLSIL